MIAIARESTENGEGPSSASKTSFALPSQNNYSITPVVQVFWTREDQLCNGACVVEEEVEEEVEAEVEAEAEEEVEAEILEEIVGEILEEIQG